MSTSEKCDPDSQSLVEIKEMPKVKEICKSGQYQKRLSTCISCYFCEQNIHNFLQEINIIYNLSQKSCRQSNSAIKIYFFLCEYLHTATLHRSLYYSTAQLKVTGLFLAAWNVTFLNGM